MQRGKIDLSAYGLFHEYSRPLLRWRSLVIGLPVALAGLYAWYVYDKLYLRFNPDHESFPGPELMAYFFLFMAQWFPKLYQIQRESF